MSSTCILSPSRVHNNKASKVSSSSLTTPTPPTEPKPVAFHPALRPSTMQQQQNQYNNNNNNSDMDSYQSANELLHDTVTLLSGNKGPTRVILSVFKTSIDHFALVYPDNRRKAVAIKPAGCINLRSVTCEETTLGAGLRGFTLRPKKCDTSSAALTFICSDLSLLPKWLEVLSSSSDEDNSCKSPNNFSSNKRLGGGGGGGGRPNPPMRRSAPRLSSLSSLDEEDEE